MNVEEYRTYEDAFLMVINEGFFDIHGYKLTCQKAHIDAVRPSSDQKCKTDMDITYRFVSIPGQNPKTKLSSKSEESDFYFFLKSFMQNCMGNSLSIRFVNQRCVFPWGTFPSY